MQRVLTDKLIEWKDKPDRKPLLLQGIRHSGKTFLLREFGTKYFKDILYIDFSRDKYVSDLFSHYSDAKSLIKDLSIYFETDIRPADTLIIFDEIQHCPAALESLRFFSDISDDYYIAAAGSYLGVALPQGMSIPVSCVDLLTLYPMSFYEFLLAQSPMLAYHLKESGFNGEPYKTFQKQLDDKFNDYKIIGGMPEVVKCWIDTKSIETVNTLQSQIIREFESDFACLAAPAMLPKLIAVWNAIPAQLIKGNRKFMFSKVRKCWRGKDLDDAVYWLVRAGFVYKIEHIEQPGFPISAYVNPAHFKLYMCDTGLLRRCGQFPSSAILSRGNDFSEIKGVVVENIVCCELMMSYRQNLYYWSAENPAKAEVDFIVNDGTDLIPIEVKAGSAGRARSLQQYQARFKPKMSVLTGSDIDKDNILPLCAFWNVKEWLRKQ